MRLLVVQRAARLASTSAAALVNPTVARGLPQCALKAARILCVQTFGGDGQDWAAPILKSARSHLEIRRLRVVV